MEPSVRVFCLCQQHTLLQNKGICDCYLHNMIEQCLPIPFVLVDDPVVADKLVSRIYTTYEHIIVFHYSWKRHI